MTDVWLDTEVLFGEPDDEHHDGICIASGEDPVAVLTDAITTIGQAKRALLVYRDALKEELALEMVGS